MAVTYDGGAITLDKPPANSYDIDYMRELGAAIEAASADDSVRVVVVRSASEKFFCAGADIKAFAANDVDANMDMIRLAHEALASIARSPQAVRGLRSRPRDWAAAWRSRWPATCATRSRAATASAPPR